jgi:protein RecA
MARSAKRRHWKWHAARWRIHQQASPCRSPVSPDPGGATPGKPVGTVCFAVRQGLDHAHGRRQVEQDIQAVSTGSLGLDIALGIGGLPRGRVVEIYGPESSGKTTLTLQVIAEMQKQGGTAAFIDAEHALDRLRQKLGVNVERSAVSQPDTGEQALEICDMLVRSGGGGRDRDRLGRGAVPKAEIEGEMGDSHWACRRA